MEWIVARQRENPWEAKSYLVSSGVNERKHRMPNQIFIVLYKFRVKPGCESEFEAAWEALTLWFYNHAGSLGSRLHEPEGTNYFAYAQWPDNETWDQAGQAMTADARKWSEAIKSYCSVIDILYKGKVSRDLLRFAPLSPED